jgi:hypothetical protein
MAKYREASIARQKSSNATHFHCNWFPGSAYRRPRLDIPVHWSGFLERGRPRPLNSPFMQTQPVLVFGLKGEKITRTVYRWFLKISHFSMDSMVPASVISNFRGVTLICPSEITVKSVG